jgi:hypothetical protein
VDDNRVMADEGSVRVWGVRLDNRPPAFFLTLKAAESYSRHYDGTVFVARERCERPDPSDV